MDSVPDGFGWALFLRCADLLDRARNESPVSVCVALATALFHLLAGRKIDLLLNAVFIAFNNGTLITTALQAVAQYVPFSKAAYINGICVHFAITMLAGSKSSWSGPPQPYLIPCRTSHTRLFPKKHTFSYSYLTVGVPVGYKGTMNGLVKTDMWPSTTLVGWFLRPFFWRWFSVHAEDHLERGHPELDLRMKLDRYLESESVDPEEFPHAYLITAPRFAGYNFNPVSFWFLYSKDKVLSGIISEVNNTFDERRPYLLLRDFDAEEHRTSGSTDRHRVKGLIEKDFHVSPFNSRKGVYTVLAQDPLSRDIDGFRGLDVTITLNSSKNHPKLVARLFSDDEAVDPNNLGLFSKQIFIAKWFWVGFATFPRIVKEAAALFYRRKLHVWYRPEPLEASTGRHATSQEKVLEMCFRKYLAFLVSQSKDAISVRYRASGLDDSTELVFDSPSADAHGAKERLKLSILTPAFYLRFIHYSDNATALSAEISESRTMSADKPERLAAIFSAEAARSTQHISLIGRLYLKMIRNTRRRPHIIPESSTSAEPAGKVHIVATDDFHTSPLDLYMATCDDGQLKRAYRWNTLQRFVVKRFFAGYEIVLSITALLLRIAVAWVFTSLLVRAAKTVRLTAL